jgi:hypothetical protein
MGGARAGLQGGVQEGCLQGWEGGRVVLLKLFKGGGDEPMGAGVPRCSRVCRVYGSRVTAGARATLLLCETSEARSVRCDYGGTTPYSKYAVQKSNEWQPSSGVRARGPPAAAWVALSVRCCCCCSLPECMSCPPGDPAIRELSFGRVGTGEVISDRAG